MAAFRTVSSLLKNGAKSAGRRTFSQQARRLGSASVKPAFIGGLSLAAGALAYQSLPHKSEVFPAVCAATVPTSQPSVFSGTKEHALYLWIHLKPQANVKACAKVMANLQQHVDKVCPPDMRDEDDEVLAGVGFGPNFYAQVAGKTKKNYVMPHRKGNLGEMPNTGGEIFIHAKSHSRSKLFELAWSLLRALPPGSVDSCEDIYGWVFQNGRDLSGFIDGTENAADDESREKIAVEPGTGGSYVITQKWLHDLDTISKQKDSTLEGWVGRSRPDSTEISRKLITSHVARMTGGNNFEQPKPFEIVRQSQPFGSVTGEHGLFFIGYAASPANHEFMLERMSGAGGDGHSDDIMRFSKCVKGMYWYFPGVEELKRLK